MAKGENEGGSWLAQGKGFFSESVEELKKVTTPTRAETFQATMVTLVMMLFFSLTLFLLDQLFRWTMSQFLYS